MSSFTYLSKSVVAAAAAAATAAGEEAVNHIRRLSSSEEEDAKQWSPFKNELDFRLAAFGGAIVTILVGLCIVQVLVRCFNCHPIQPASFQPAPRRILPLMSIEPAVNFTRGLTLAGGADHPECPICLSEIVEGEEIRILSNCRHGFHLKCVETWLSSQSSCPTCRNSCVKTSVNQNPPENQQPQQQNDVDLEAANPQEIEMILLQQQQQNIDVVVEAATLPESEIVVLQQQQQQATESVNYS